MLTLIKILLGPSPSQQKNTVVPKQEGPEGWDMGSHIPVWARVADITTTTMLWLSSPILLGAYDELIVH